MRNCFNVMRSQTFSEPDLGISLFPHLRQCGLEMAVSFLPYGRLEGSGLGYFPFLR